MKIKDESKEEKSGDIEFVLNMSIDKMKEMRECPYCGMYTHFLNDHCQEVCLNAYVNCQLCQTKTVRKNLRDHWKNECIKYEKSEYFFENDAYWGDRRKIQIENLPPNYHKFSKIVSFICRQWYTNQQNHGSKKKYIPKDIQIFFLHCLVYGKDAFFLIHLFACLSDNVRTKTAIKKTKKYQKKY